MKMAEIRKLTAEEQAALAAADQPVNLSDPDAPEVTDWSQARRGMLQKVYRPEKKSVTIRLDADIITWFSLPTAEGYQTRINAALRDYIEKNGG
jgi:uncharacterized protein (DUF4415 family)